MCGLSHRKMFLPIFVDSADVLSHGSNVNLMKNALSSPLLDAGQSKCRLERAQALEQAKKPQEAVFVPECGEDGSFTQVRTWPNLSGFFPSGQGPWGDDGVGMGVTYSLCFLGNSLGLFDTPPFPFLSLRFIPSGPSVPPLPTGTGSSEGAWKSEPGNWDCLVPILPAGCLRFFSSVKCRLVIVSCPCQFPWATLYSRHSSVLPPL